MNARIIIVSVKNQRKRGHGKRIRNIVYFKENIK